MPELSELTEEALEKAAVRPSSYSVDGETTIAQPIPHQIELDKYAEQKAALAGTNPNGGLKSGWNSLRPAQAILPGGV